MTIQWDEKIILDFVEDSISINISGMTWSAVKDLGKFVLAINSPEFPLFDTLTPPIAGASFEWRVTQMTSDFIQVELEIVNVPSGILPNNATNYTDTVLLIPYDKIEYVQFRVNNSVLGDERLV